MTKSEMFKAAHKLAKAYKAQVNTGDYSVYLSLALKNLNAAVKKGFADEAIFKAMNGKIAKVSDKLALITKQVKQSLTHGLKSFASQYELKAAKSELEEGQFFGKAFNKNGMINAWVRSVVIVNEAY